jgi:hypothetical protein
MSARKKRSPPEEKRSHVLLKRKLILRGDRVSLGVFM